MGNTTSAPLTATTAGAGSIVSVSNLASELKPSGEVAAKVKPCCVCKDEKSARDECMLFSKSDNPQSTDCLSLVEQYRSCMKGYGFEIQ